MTINKELKQNYNNKYYNLVISNIPKITIDRIQNKLKNMILTYKVEDVQ